MLVKFYNYFPFVACEDGALYCLATTGDLLIRYHLV